MTSFEQWIFFCLPFVLYTGYLRHYWIYTHSRGQRTGLRTRCRHGMRSRRDLAWRVLDKATAWALRIISLTKRRLRLCSVDHCSLASGVGFLHQPNSATLDQTLTKPNADPEHRLIKNPIAILTQIPKPHRKDQLETDNRLNNRPNPKYPECWSAWNRCVVGV